MAQRITLDLLTEKGACREQRTLFAKLFPNGVEVAEALCIGCAGQLDFDWAAKHLLPIQAWQEYVHTQDEAWAEYRRTRGEAQLAKWQRNPNSTRIDDEAWAEYERIRKELWAEFQRVCAAEFARLWNKYMPD